MRSSAHLNPNSQVIRKLKRGVRLAESANQLTGAYACHALRKTRCGGPARAVQAWKLDDTNILCRSGFYTPVN